MRDFGWGWYFATLMIACGLALVLLAPMTNLRSYVQRVQLQNKRAATAALPKPKQP